MKIPVVIMTFVVLLVGCGRRGGGATVGCDTRPVVTVSIAPQAWLLEAIAGDSVRINVLLPTGSNPETFEPGIGVMKQAADGDMLLLSGNIGFESQLSQRIAKNNPGMVIVDTSLGITPVYGTHSHAAMCDHDHGNEVADPHTWTSVRNARVIAANMLSALVMFDPARAGYYRERAARLDSRLDSIDRSIAARLDKLRVRSFMVWHPSLSYYARDYSLEQVSVGSEGRETTVRGLRSIIDRASADGIRVMFIQADFDSRQAETLGRETGAKVVTINPLSRDWESQINLITDALDPR